MNTNTNTATTGLNITSNQYVGVLVLGALGFLVLVRVGFRGLVVTV